MTFDPRGEHLVSADEDGTVNIWTRNGKPDGRWSLTITCPAPRLSAGTVGCSPWVAARGLVEVWDVRSGVRVMLDRHHGASINNVVFLPGDRSRLISASDDTTVAQFNCHACTDPDRVREAEEWAAKTPH